MQLSYPARILVRSFLKRISWLLFTIGMTSIVCMAQIDRAALTGTVTDPTGAIVQHAEVQAVETATGLKSEAQTNSKGVYLVPGLAVGTYAVTISHRGFGTVGLQNVLLEVGLTRVLNVTLRVSVPGEKIHVEAAQPLEQTSPEVSGVITEQQIKEIPINGRNWATLLVLAPGAIDDGGGDQRTIRFAGRGRDDNNFSSGAAHGNVPQMKPLWQMLYHAGADVVINGHDHDYERFAPQDPQGNSDPAHGIREFVVGTGGKNSHRIFAAPDPNSEVRNADAFGVLKLTLHPRSYDWEFVPEAGKSFHDSGHGGCH
jgi:hypothetical protein